MKLQSGMGVMGWLTRPYSIPYSIGLPYSYTKPSCTRPTSSKLKSTQSFCTKVLSLVALEWFFTSVKPFMHSQVVLLVNFLSQWWRLNGFLQV